MSRKQRPPAAKSFVVATARAALAGLLVAGLVALPAWSARVVDVRVGQHPKFTRVVFELDQSTGYSIDRSTEEGVLRVKLSASARAESIQVGGGVVKSVIVEQGVDGSVARIVLGDGAPPAQEMILAKPPRIVLDVMKPAAASAPATKPMAKPSPPAPKPMAKPAPAPKPMAKPAPAPKPAPATAPVARTEKPSVDVPDAGTMLANPTGKPALPETLEPRREPKPERPSGSATAEAGKTTPVARDDGPGGPLDDPIVIGGAGVALLVFLAFYLMRRRKRDDDDLGEDSDVFTPSVPESPFADTGSGGSTRIPAGGFSMEDATQSDADADSPFDTPTLAPSEPSAAGGSPLASIFDDQPDSSTGDEPMTQEMSDFPADPAAAAPTSPASPQTAAGGDVALLVQQLERRMATLEGKLEEAQEAREKLERQVAAQSEELRVQRAAIARTQRALRSMSRGGGSGGGEEKATEPALRDETQARTRVSV